MLVSAIVFIPLFSKPFREVGSIEEENRKGMEERRELSE